MNAALRGALGRRTPFDDVREGDVALRFGMILFLIALGVLFAATLVGFIIIRIQLVRQDLWPADLPRPPLVLVVSTMVLALSSVTVQAAYVAARRNAISVVARRLSATLVLGGLFLALQAWAWVAWIEVIRSRWADSEAWRLALTGFFVLTGLHALHALGGMLALGLARARVNDDGLARRVRGAATYWHFLGGVWAVLYVFLLVF